MPLYSTQVEPGGQNIGPYPIYQGFVGPAFVNGVAVPFYTQKYDFYNIWPNYVQSLAPTSTGNGTTGPYTLDISAFPALPGHVDLTGIISTGSTSDPIFTNTFNASIPTTSIFSGVYFTATDVDGNNIVVADSGLFLSGNTGGDLYGLLMQPGQAPYGNVALTGVYSTTSNTINYATGQATFSFPTAIPSGNPINAQSYSIQQGLPRAILFYNNCITLRNPPNTQYMVSLEAYLSPAAFLNTSSAIPFAYMAEYIARGAARKILSDTGDVEQLQFYEPFFREQEMLVWKRSQRQFTATRTATIFSENRGPSNSNMGLGVN